MGWKLGIDGSTCISKSDIDGMKIGYKTIGIVCVSFYSFRKKMLLQGTTIGSQSNIINLVVSITTIKW